LNRFSKTIQINLDQILVQTKYINVFQKISDLQRKREEDRIEKEVYEREEQEQRERDREQKQREKIALEQKELEKLQKKQEEERRKLESVNNLTDGDPPSFKLNSSNSESL